MSKRKNRFLLKYSGICAAILIIVSLFSIFFYFNSRAVLQDSVDARLIANLKTASLYIDPAKHEELRTKYAALGFAGDEDAAIHDADYLDVVDDLYGVLQSSEAQYIYTIAKHPILADTLYYVIDAADMKDRTNQSYLGETFTGLSEESYNFFLQAFENPNEIFVSEITDDYGKHMTGIMAINNVAGNVEMVLCVDLTTDFIERHQCTFLISILALNATLLIAFLVLGFILKKLLKKNADMQEKIEHMAYYDSLTTLPNRVSLIEKLEYMIKAVDENPSYSLSLFFIDLDNFKKVNDTEGHVTGDLLLQAVAKFLKSHSNLKPLYKGNTKEFVARLGGDEFVLIYPIKESDDIKRLVNTLYVDFENVRAENPIINKYNVSLSIGVSVYPKDADSISNMLKTADKAMYAAKKAGKGQYAIFTKDLEEGPK